MSLHFRGPSAVVCHSIVAYYWLLVDFGCLTVLTRKAGAGLVTRSLSTADKEYISTIM